FHSERDAKEAKDWWEKTFSQREFPEDAPVVKLSEEKLKAADFLLKIGGASSKNEAKRIIQGGGLKINGEKITNPQEEIEIKGELKVKVGKKKSFRVIKEE
ncbi:S4 domain-containing protein, partial [Aquifex sp.]